MKLLLILACSISAAWGQQGHEPPDEARRGIASHRTLYHYFRGGLDDPVIPLSRLAPDLQYPLEALSLIADPKDRYQGEIAVYLVNATDQPMKGGAGADLSVFQELKDGKFWKRSHPFEASDCALGDHTPADLPAGHARLLIGLDPAAGDTEAVLRYCVFIEGKAIASPLVLGRFSGKGFEQAALELFQRTHQIFSGIPNGDEPFDWTTNRDASAGEQLIAALQLQRAYDESSYLRRSAARWLAYLNAHEGDPRCREALHSLLQQPWEHVQDEQCFFDRCFAALSADPHNDWPYGSPERFPALVWSQLTGQNTWTPSQNPERVAKLEEIAKSGNPWGAPDKQATQLIDLALSRLKSSQDADSAAAGSFLSGSWIPAEKLPDDVVRSFLKIDSPAARSSALMILKQRGMALEAGGWLAAHRKELGKETASLWRALSSRGPMPKWEIEIALELLNEDSAMVLRELGYRAESTLEAGNEPPLPEVFRPWVRELLQKELSAPRVTGGSPPTRDAQGKWNIESSRDVEEQERLLYPPLVILAHWKKAEDLDLLHSFLAHPSGRFEVADDTRVTKIFELRYTVRDLLKKRGDAVPADIQLRQDFP